MTTDKKLNNLILEIKELKLELKRYKKAYVIMMEHFDDIPDKERLIIDKKLNKIDL